MKCMEHTRLRPRQRAGLSPDTGASALLLPLEPAHIIEASCR